MKKTTKLLAASPLSPVARALRARATIKESGHFYKFLSTLQDKILVFHTCSFIRIIRATFFCFFSLSALQNISSWYLPNTPTLHFELKVVRPIIPHKEVRRCECTNYCHPIHESCTTPLSRNFIAFEKKSIPTVYKNALWAI